MTPWASHSFSFSLAVQSTSPMSTFLELSNFSPSSSQSGFIFLQWPHQGAWNFTKADFVPKTFLSKFFAVSSTGSPRTHTV